MLSSWIMSILSGIFIVVSDYFLTKEINAYAIQVFFGFLMLSGGTTAMSVYEKIKSKTTKTEEE